MNDPRVLQIAKTLRSGESRDIMRLAKETHPWVESFDEAVAVLNDELRNLVIELFEN